MSEVLEAFYIGEKPGMDGANILFIFGEDVYFYKNDIITEGSNTYFITDSNRGWIKCKLVTGDKVHYCNITLGVEFLKLGTTYEQ
jgi:hypothetical protein